MPYCDLLPPTHFRSVTIKDGTARKDDDDMRVHEIFSEVMPRPLRCLFQPDTTAALAGCGLEASVGTISAGVCPLPTPKRPIKMFGRRL